VAILVMRVSGQQKAGTAELAGPASFPDTSSAAGLGGAVASLNPTLPARAALAVYRWNSSGSSRSPWPSG